MTADTISKTEKSLEERGLPKDSYFEVTFKDGSKASEHDTNWSDLDVHKVVQKFGHQEVAFICKHPLKSIRIVHNSMEAVIDEIPAGYEVYQYVRSERLVAGGVDRHTISGRGIGLIKDGVVLEERYINALENRVQGMRK